jgi:hypothetical protein
MSANGASTSSHSERDLHMQNEEVTAESLENLLLKMQEEIMNRPNDDDDEGNEQESSDEGVEYAIQRIRKHFGLKEYPFTGNQWWEKPSTEIARRLEFDGVLETSLR